MGQRFTQFKEKTAAHYDQYSTYLLGHHAQMKGWLIVFACINFATFLVTWSLGTLLSGVILVPPVTALILRGCAGIAAVSVGAWDAVSDITKSMRDTVGGFFERIVERIKLAWGKLTGRGQTEENTNNNDGPDAGNGDAFVPDAPVSSQSRAGAAAILRAEQAQPETESSSMYPSLAAAAEISEEQQTPSLSS